jgi:hypothetical protein
MLIWCKDCDTGTAATFIVHCAHGLGWPDLGLQGACKYRNDQQWNAQRASERVERMYSGRVPADADGTALSPLRLSRVGLPKIASAQWSQPGSVV